jgi:Ni,Fe-hydrogenase III large subunit
MHYLTIKNHQAVPVQDIPEISCSSFFVLNTGLVSESPARHCVNYFGYKTGESVKLICCIADDSDQVILISSCIVHTGDEMTSLTSKLFCFEKFEREIHENFGLNFIGHPWLKPVRYPSGRADKTKTIANYPFYTIDSHELHEVGVGPIHAGIIEPGHFRFICNGEQILHLEIQLGYQHRGIEGLLLDKKKLLERTTLAESIAGDTVVGHTTAFSNAWECLCGVEVSRDVALDRTIALELERIAIHTGDLSAVCTDIAYQLGSSVFGRLRTPIINFMQEWCGSRMSKGLIRPGRIKYPFTPHIAKRLYEVLDAFEPDFIEMNRELFQLTSALSRFERTGVVSAGDAFVIGAVGMTARMAGITRDIRISHPYLLYPELEHEPVVKHHGDVYSRVQIRKEEVLQSIRHLRILLSKVKDPVDINTPNLVPGPELFTLSLVEGWRGEICHCAITGFDGELLVYKIKDPSFHNWLALALAVRNNEISDFPVCNKSFNLSYCGHDL